MAAANIPLKLNDKGQATPEAALRAALDAINAVKIDYSGMTEEQIGRLRRLAASVAENASHVVSRARREFTDQVSGHR
jgi:ribosome recycling factor